MYKFYVQQLFFRKLCHLWDNLVKYRRTGRAKDDNIIRSMRNSWWATNTKNTHSEYRILNVSARRQWLRQLAFILRYTRIACLFILMIGAIITIEHRHFWISRQQANHCITNDFTSETITLSHSPCYGRFYLQKRRIAEAKFILCNCSLPFAS